MVIVIVANKNWYRYVAIEIASILENNNDNVSKIYLILDDKDFPYFRDDPRIEVKCYYDFPQVVLPSSPNMSTYFSNLAHAMPSLYQWIDEDKIICMDGDVIVDGDLMPLWNTELGDNLIAGAREESLSQCYPPFYINTGILLMDLKALRDTGYGDKALEEYNTVKHQYIFQDVYNKICNGRIKEISYIYNSNNWTKNSDDAVCKHGAGPSSKPWEEGAFHHKAWLWYKDIFENKYEGKGCHE